MILETQELDTQLIQLLNEDGYIIIKNFFEVDYINQIKEKAFSIFEKQFEFFGYEGDFTEKMITLFNEHEDIFINCGKIIQTGLIELYQLSVENKVLSLIKSLGLDFPNLCTRPVMFFNHPSLAKEEYYYKTPPHQDYPSMESSLDSIVLWVPLVDVSKKNGSLLIWPKSHKNGVLKYESVGGFASVNTFGEPIQLNLSMGDIVIFSTFLVHASGDILDNSIRWSCHFRYTNMSDFDFIQRGFPSPYTYKPKTKND